MQDVFSRIVTAVVTVICLAAVWGTIVVSLPSEEELSARETVASALTTAEADLRAAIFHHPKPPEVTPLPEPTLDLSIPGVDPTAPYPSGSPHAPAELRPIPGGNGVMPDSPAVQAARLKCEAEIEQLCPDTGDEAARAQCLRERARQLGQPCRAQLREHFVKWKQTRNRLAMACDGDVQRYCAEMEPGEGRILQCLQTHAQEVSDRCYQALPKGALLFKQ